MSNEKSKQWREEEMLLYVYKFLQDSKHVDDVNQIILSLRLGKDLQAIDRGEHDG